MLKIYIVGTALGTVGFLLITTALFSHNWIVLDHTKIHPTYAVVKDHLGLWKHCSNHHAVGISSKSQELHLPDGLECLWTYRFGMHVPAYIVMNQFCFTISFLAISVFVIYTLAAYLFYSSEYFLKSLVSFNFSILLFAGLLAAVGAISFVALNSGPGYKISSYYYGYSFMLACVGAASTLMASALFFAESWKVYA